MVVTFLRSGLERDVESPHALGDRITPSTANRNGHGAPMCATLCTTMARRAGRTVKLSISLDERDFALLSKRAKRVSGGNISAAITEMIRIAREWEGREALARWLGEGHEEPSTEAMDRVRAEWRGMRHGKRRTKA